jgi:arylsulfatase A-like enzyme
MATVRRALGFGLVCGLIGASFEAARLGVGGIALALSLRLTLLAVYALLAVSAYLAVALLTAAPRRRAALAGGVIAALILVPWVNVEFLPAALSARSLLGSAAAVVAAFLAAAAAARVPRVSAVAALLAFALGNATGRPGAGSSGGTGGVVADTTRPSVVVVLIDTLRADHLGVYGYDKPTSPHIDRLAAESVLFERTIAQAAWTKPSVASLFTGRFVHHHGVIRSRDALGAELPTLAAEFRANGYRTAAFSGNPWITPEFRFDRGFDEFASGRPMGPQLTVLYKLLKRIERGLGRAAVRLPLTDLVFFTATEESPINAVRDEQMTDAVTAWLDDAPETPFFLYVHFIGPHDPYDPPQEFVSRFQRDEAPYPTLPPARVQTVFEAAEPLDDMSHRKLVAQYDAAIAHVDSLFGRVEESLRRLGEERDILLVVTADHGEEFYEHRNWRHGNQLYDEVIHVPLLVWMPKRLGSGRRSDPAMLVDLFPTVLDLAGLPQQAPPGDGVALFRGGAALRPEVFSEHRWFEGGDYIARMVERGALKLHDVQDDGRRRQRQELYDLASDRGESNNLIDDPPAAVGEQVPAMLASLAEFGAAGGVAMAPSVSKIDPQTQERLRALGYGDGAEER